MNPIGIKQALRNKLDKLFHINRRCEYGYPKIRNYHPIHD